MRCQCLKGCERFAHDDEKRGFWVAFSQRSLEICAIDVGDEVHGKLGCRIILQSIAKEAWVKVRPANTDIHDVLKWPAARAATLSLRIDSLNA